MSKNKQINIFIVEDNKIFTLALKADIETAFDKKPIKVHSFETGETCMLKFNEIKPQVVILDYQLNSKYPDAADGIKVLDWIKRQESDTNVIMLSGNDNIEIALKSFHHGASDYVVKTETKFRKINYSLFNIFKIIEAKSDARGYKRLAYGLCAGIVLWVGGLLLMSLFTPHVPR